MSVVQIVTIDPAHFHAALVHKEMLPGIDRRVHLYAPQGPDVDMHLHRMSGFQTRADKPTNWELRSVVSPSFMREFLKARPGNVVVLAGRNRTKIDTMLQCVEAGYHVLADKPWINRHDDFRKLETLVLLASGMKRVVFDMMTERFEITSVLQREFVRDQDLFGTILMGSPEQPAIRMESVHALQKTVAGQSLRRPVSFFDVSEQGESLTDVGTHLVDLVQWIVFAEQPVQPNDVEVLLSERWPTPISPRDFADITGSITPPDFLPRDAKGDFLYPCNNRVVYRIRGIHVELITRWDVTCPAGDTHFASFRGSKATTEIRQVGGPPQLYVRTQNGGSPTAAISQLGATFPGLSASSENQEWRIAIPDVLRTGHEAHFREVTAQFLKYVGDPAQIPAWEEPNLLTKYWTTTLAVAKAG